MKFSLLISRFRRERSEHGNTNDILSIRKSYMLKDKRIGKKNYFLLLVFSIFFCLALLADFPKSFIYGQSRNDSNDLGSPSNTNSQIERKRIVDKNKLTIPIILATAIVENSKLRNTLEWDFGTKAQRGWYLYIPLIQQTINTNDGEETLEFARAVAVWQQKSGLNPSGIIDSETLYQMIAFWQSRRLNSDVYPSPEALLTAPIADFYDPTRDVELLKVERETYKAYKKMLAAAIVELKLKIDKSGALAEDEKFLKIISAFRSREYQAKLRAASPQSGRAGLALNSSHFTGHALDIYVGGEPVTTKDFNRAAQVETPVYKWLVKNAARFGFYPYFYEPWHWEYVSQNLKPTGDKILSAPSQNTNLLLP